MKLITIEGGISSGKSTIIENIKENLEKFILVDEPVKDWEKIKDERGKGILECFYENQKTVGFTFQIAALLLRYKSLKKAFIQAEEFEKTSNGLEMVIVTERTILSDFYIFASMLYKEKIINELDYQVYKEWFNVYKDEFKLSKSVYVKTTPEICLNRIACRGRDGENLIPLEYLEKLHIQHEKFYNEILIKHDCLIINNDNEMDEDEYKQKIEIIFSHLFN